MQEPDSFTHSIATRQCSPSLPRLPSHLLILLCKASAQLLPWEREGWCGPRGAPTGASPKCMAADGISL